MCLTLLYTAVGTLGNSSQGTYAAEGQGTETSAYAGEGGDSVSGSGGGGGPSGPLGTYSTSGDVVRGYTYADQTSHTGTDGGTFSVYQAGTYGNGSYALASYLYQAQGQRAWQDYGFGATTEEGTGSADGTASGNRLTTHSLGSYSYEFAGGGSWSNNETSTLNYSLREEGSNGGLPTVIYQESGTHSFTRWHTNASSYESVGYDEEYEDSYEATGTSAYALYERGSHPSATTWSLDSYSYTTEGQSLETYYTDYSVSYEWGDSVVCYSQDWSETEDAVVTQTWLREERGYREAGAGRGEEQPFAWTHYREETAYASTSTYHAEGSLDISYTPDTGGGPIFEHPSGIDGWQHKEFTHDRYRTEQRSFYAEGPETPGPAFSFESYVFTSTSLETTAVDEEGEKHGSYDLEWWSDDDTVLYHHIAQTGDGLEGVYTVTDTGTRTSVFTTVYSGGPPQRPEPLAES